MEMAFKFSNLQILLGFLARRALLRIVVFVLAITTVCVLKFVSDADMMEIFSKNTDECDRNSFFPGQFLKPITFYPFPLSEGSSQLPAPSPCNDSANLTSNIFRELKDKKILNSGARALCLGEGSASAVSVLQGLGFASTFRVSSRLFPSLVRKGFDYKLSYEENFFDFIFSRSLDRAVIPALLVLEMERVLKPGGFGVVLIRTISSSKTGTMIKVAASISSFLKGSDIVHVYQIDGFTLVAFKKQAADKNCFDELHRCHPEHCRSITKNKKFMKHLEPLVKEKPVGFQERISYLPNFMDITSCKKLIYIDIGAGGFLNSSIVNWFLLFYPMQSQAFDIYAVDGDKSLGTSYAKRPGVTFVHYPWLSEEPTSEVTPELGSLPHDATSDFLNWFKKIVAGGDFVVLKMDVGRTGLILLRELLRNGAMCSIDELFLRCPNTSSGQGSICEDCSHFIGTLRSHGVFAHQW